MCVFPNRRLKIRSGRIEDPFYNIHANAVRKNEMKLKSGLRPVRRRYVSRALG